MRTLSQHDGQSGQLTADIEARIRLLFARYPTLCGFAVQSRGQLPEHSDPYPIPEADLCLTDVGVHPNIGWQYESIQDEIVCALADLVQERPQAHLYLCGRTFARMLH